MANSVEGDDVRVPEASERPDFRLKVVLALQARGIQHFDGDLCRSLQPGDTKQRCTEHTGVDLAVAPRAEQTVGGKSIRRVVERVVAEESHAVSHFDVGCSCVCGDRVPWRRGHGLGRRCRRRNRVLGRSRDRQLRANERQLIWVCEKFCVFEDLAKGGQEIIERNQC